MACFADCDSNWEIKIDGFEFTNNITFYIIKVRFGTITWTVKRRYSEFLELADKLSIDHGLSKDTIPPKKFHIFKSRPNVGFIRSRITGLEQFLKASFDILKATMPRSLVVFLAIDSYEIYYVLESLSLRLSAELANLAEEPNITSEVCCLSLLEVHALTKVLKLPRPPLEIYGLRLDYSDIFEMCGMYTNILINGDADCFVFSNLAEHNLTFDLSVFKSIKHLSLFKVNLKSLTDASDLRQKLLSLTVDNCDFTELVEVLLCDQKHHVLPANASLSWTGLTEISITNNLKLAIMEGAELVPNVKKASLMNSVVENILPLKAFKEVQHMNICGNSIYEVEHFSSSFPNLVSLDLSCNAIRELRGIEFMRKLTILNLSFNEIEMAELRHIVKLPLLYDLVLLGNPIATAVDYRIKVLVEFGKSYKQITLDNEETTQNELDRVAVIQALNARNIVTRKHMIADGPNSP